ncbi:unnamed protein product, partial [Didymodactylos carnosus]
MIIDRQRFRSILTVFSFILFLFFISTLTKNSLLNDNSDTITVRNESKRKHSHILPHLPSSCHSLFLTYDDLILDKYHLRNSIGIPFIIHQTWKSYELRSKQKNWTSTWCKNHQNQKWTYVLWTDDDNRRLVRDYFPFFLTMYDSLTPFVCKVDVVRIMYMYLFGGVYIDLDYESLKPIDELLYKRKLIFGMMTYDYGTKESFPNSWFASEAKQKFWLFVLAKIWDRWELKPNYNVNFNTGPNLLFDSIEMYIKSQLLTSKSFDELIPKQNNKIVELCNMTFLPPHYVNA